MITQDLQRIIRERIANEITIRTFDDHRIGVSLPITFGDGDACEVIVEAGEHGSLTISDDGFVVARGRMNGTSLLSAGYADRFRRVAKFYGAEESSGELRLSATTADIGDSIFVFVQACLELSRLAQRAPDAKRKSRAFLRTFRRVVESGVSGRNTDWQWHDPQSDPKGVYQVDCKVVADSQDWFIFGAGSSAKCWKAASAVQHYKLEKYPAKTVFAFGESAENDPAALTAMADNSDYVFSLKRERTKLVKFLRENVRRAG